MTVLTTARLLLDPLTASHADALYEIYSETAVRRFLITRPADRGEFDRLFDHALHFANSHGMWAVIDRATSAVIGRVGFFAFGAQRRPELAFLLAQRMWGHGLATEAAAAALRDGFARHGWHEIVALVRPENAAAIRVLGKLGMESEQRCTVAGEPVVIYALRRQAFSL